MMCRGNVTVSEKRSVPISLVKPSVYKGLIEFPVVQTMVPSCRLLVYFVRKDGEVVADSMVVDIEDILDNQVYMHHNCIIFIFFIYYSWNFYFTESIGP